MKSVGEPPFTVQVPWIPQGALPSWVIVRLWLTPCDGGGDDGAGRGDGGRQKGWCRRLNIPCAPRDPMGCRVVSICAKLRIQAGLCPVARAERAVVCRGAGVGRCPAAGLVAVVGGPLPALSPPDGGLRPPGFPDAAGIDAAGAWS